MDYDNISGYYRRQSCDQNTILIATRHYSALSGYSPFEISAVRQMKRPKIKPRITRTSVLWFYNSNKSTHLKLNVYYVKSYLTYCSTLDMYTWVEIHLNIWGERANNSKRHYIELEQQFYFFFFRGVVLTSQSSLLFLPVCEYIM